ncbi:MAG: nucleotidyltransferase domain-containing protein [Coprothermobacterota bacterium]|nr:nucleotidyltransferase domain-containing protein [Coprothermobacterota bacterium]
MLDSLAQACKVHYGARLVSLAIFGSVGRGTMKPDSDIDLLIVASPLPYGRMKRVEGFRPVEDALEPEILKKRILGIHTYLSPIFKTPAEISSRPLILLDLTEDARILFDRDGFLRGQLEALKERLRELGARRVVQGEAWWWDLKPDFKPGEVFQL